MRHCHYGIVPHWRRQLSSLPSFASHLRRINENVHECRQYPKISEILWRPAPVRDRSTRQSTFSTECVVLHLLSSRRPSAVALDLASPSHHSCPHFFIIVLTRPASPCLIHPHALTQTKPTLSAAPPCSSSLLPPSSLLLLPPPPSRSSRPSTTRPTLRTPNRKSLLCSVVTHAHV